MFSRIKKNLSMNLQASIGQRVNEKIVLFESDDWGGIRMPSTQAYNRLINKGLPIQDDHFNRFDSQASVDDLTALFEVLSKHQDRKGNCPCFTFNVTTGNPDFSKIQKHSYTKFFTEPFYDTVQRSRPGALELWKEGIDGGLTFPQYHGREHVHQQRWLQKLESGDLQVRLAFEEGVFGIGSSTDKAEFFMAACDYPSNQEWVCLQESIDEGLQIFESFFGFVPKSFIPPCYIASPQLLAHLQSKGVIALQGKLIHLEPKGIIDGKRMYKRHLRKSGRNTKDEGVNLIRNCFFEPSSKPEFDWVGNCLKRMEVAFRWGKPVIIDTHRVNYIGELVESNRTSNLVLLNMLLGKMLKKWTDITFMNSEQLVNFYTKNHE